MTLKKIAAAAALFLAAFGACAQSEPVMPEPPPGEPPLIVEPPSKPPQASTAQEASKRKSSYDLPKPLQSLDGQSFDQAAGGPLVSGLVLALADEDWAKKWSDSKQSLPKLRETRLLKEGQKSQVVVFLAARPDMKELELSTPIEYAIDVYTPDGSFQERLEGNKCMNSGQKLGPGGMVVCESMIDFLLEPQDPRGLWVFKVILAVPGQKELVFATSFESL